MSDWLIDKSALWKLPRSPDYPGWIERINAGRVWVGLPTVLEVAVSSGDAEDSTKIWILAYIEAIMTTNHVARVQPGREFRQAGGRCPPLPGRAA